MGRRPKQYKVNSPIPMSKSAQEKLEVNYLTELETNPKYALIVDPENKYKLCEAQKEFIKHYIDFRSVATAAELTGIDMDLAKEYFATYDVQSEIRRINLALYHHQFASKLLSLDEIGGYLSSLLTDQYTPLCNQLKTTDKLRVVDLIIKLNEMKTQALQNPVVIIEKDINAQLKDLSVEAIQQLLVQTNNKPEDKAELIDKLNPENTLTIEEKAYLETLSTTELLQLLNDTMKEGKNE